jgi:hypothetical protein
MPSRRQYSNFSHQKVGDFFIFMVNTLNLCVILGEGYKPRAKCSVPLRLRPLRQQGGDAHDRK